MANHEVLHWLIKKENGESKMCVLVSFDFSKGKTPRDGTIARSN
jgi:hypothetical protein